MNDEAEVIESEELDQAEELDEESDIEAGDDNESAGDDDFSDIDEDEDFVDDDELEGEESEGEESDDEKTVQKEGDAKDGTRENAKETAADEEPGEAEVLSQFSRDQIPGTDEYTDALIDQAKEFVKAKTGEEYDPFEPKHQALFTQACNKLDRLATESFNKAYDTAKADAKYKHAHRKAGETLDSILTTPELVAQFENAVGDLKQRDFEAIVKKSRENNDFSGFIDIAKSIKTAKEKVKTVNQRQAKIEKSSGVIRDAEAKTRNEPKKIGKNAFYGGVKDFMGL